jgi:hypothetical protein
MPASHDDSPIPGWFNFAAVYDRMIAAAPDPAAFVEVGAWLGKSTVHLARAIRASAKHVTLYAVDTWAGSPGEDVHAAVVAAHGGDLFPAFRANLERCGVADLVRPIRLPSVEAAVRFDDQSLDFVFIDAAHDYTSVAADIRAWFPKVKVGGYLGGHDYGTWDGVTRAVGDLLGPVEVIPEATSWLLRKPADRTVPDFAALPSGAPVVSVVLPVRSAGDDLARSIAAVLGQSLGRWELLVAAAGDTPMDEIAVPAADDPRVRRVPEGVGRSVSAARNTAVRDARGAVVAYLDPGDEFAPDYLARLAAAGPDAVIVSAYDLAGPDGLTRWDPGRARAFRHAQLIAAPFAVAHARALLNRAGLFDLRLGNLEGAADLLRRLDTAGGRFVYDLRPCGRTPDRPDGPVLLPAVTVPGQPGDGVGSKV